ncbi:hypothetical protein R1sor_013494 [Riccia sorocarpa]|uniref:C2 domain-containing protein n=1 Tax=Riccia sorocarpa TaxID=122646 RepID=A0ABD3HAA9_9MARC
MSVGTLKINLVGASGIRDSEWLGKGDPYVVVEYGDKHIKSNTATDQGSNPKWNQKLHFIIDDSVTEIVFKIYNQNNLQVDDLVGSLTIPLEDVFQRKKLPIQTYTVKPRGELNIQLSYTPEVIKPAVQHTTFFHGPYDPQVYSSPYTR